MPKQTARTEKAKADFILLVGKEGYTLHSEYVNSQTKVKLKCPQGDQFEMVPNNFARGQRCPRCLTPFQRRAKEAFFDMLEEEGYICLRPYVNTNSKVLLQCPGIEPHTFEMTPACFRYQGQRCPHCRFSSRTQSKIRFLKQLDKEQYRCLGEYVGSHELVLIECPKGDQFYVTPGHFMNNSSRCPRCSRKCPKQAEEEFLEALGNEGYKHLGKYTGSDKKTLIECPKGDQFYMTPSSFKSSKNRCPACAGRCPVQARANFDELLLKEGYLLVGPYKNVRTKVHLICPSALKHDYFVTPNNFKAGGRRCAECAKLQTMSLGERTALAHITALGVDFLHDRAKFFSERPQLRPDFVIPHLKFMVEVDGPEHFEKTSRGQYKKALHANDLFKNRWCAENGWHLLRIKYIHMREAPKIPGLIDTAFASIHAQPDLLLAPPSYYYS